MALKVNAGYLGYLNIGGSIARATSFEVTPTQDLLFYDHVQGLNDTMTGLDTKGEAIGAPVIQRTIWRPSPLSMTASMSFPLTDGNSAAQSLFNYAATGSVFNIYFKHSCKDGQSLSGCRVNTFSFSVSAGEVATVSASVLAMGIGDGGSGGLYTKREKLVTWDAVEIGGYGGDGIYSFSFDINNNAQYIYTAGGSDLFPKEIRLGTQSVTGMLSIYNLHGSNYIPTYGQAVSMISVSAGGVFGANIKCVFQPKSIAGQVGAIMSAIPFTGVDYPFG